MRSEGNPLDLNNLPEDYTRSDGLQTSWDSSSSAGGGGGGGVGYRKKKSGGGKEGRDEAAKVYECRFCSLKFCKSQALGGHMNRHRQERETETLNKARQLVFTNDLAPAHLGYVSSSTSGQQFPHGGYNSHHQASNSNNNMGDSSLPFRSMHHPSRMFSTSPHIPPPPHQAAPPPPYMHSSPSHQYLPPANNNNNNNSYYVGHVLPYGAAAAQNDTTCIGAPVGGGGAGGGFRR